MCSYTVQKCGTMAKSVTTMMICCFCLSKVDVRHEYKWCKPYSYLPYPACNEYIFTILKMLYCLSCLSFSTTPGFPTLPKAYHTCND